MPDHPPIFRFKGKRVTEGPLTMEDLRDFIVRLARTVPPGTPTNIVKFDVDTTPSGPNVTFHLTPENELPS